MRWCGPPGEPRDRQVEAAPEEVNRTDLADERCTEPVERFVCPDQDVPETPGVLSVVSAAKIVVERHRGDDFHRNRPDAECDVESREASHHLMVEGLYRQSRQRQGVAPAITRADGKGVIEEVEFELEAP